MTICCSGLSDVSTIQIRGKAHRMASRAAMEKRGRMRNAGRPKPNRSVECGSRVSLRLP